jgi:rSAM/selenodomain-associated transferase 2
MKTSEHRKVDISIIIPVLNEGTGINQTINLLFHQKFSGIFEVIVVDGSEDGNTINCIETSDNIKNLIKLTSPQGRGCQMNKGAVQALGETLLFLHCDTTLPDNGLESIQSVMKNQFIKAGAFDLSINARGAAYRIIENAASFRSRITRIPYGDQAIFIHKNYFFDIGQYREIPIMEDVDLMLRIKKARGRIQFLNTKTSTSARRWQKEGAIYCTLRNLTIITLYFLGINPEKLAAFYKKNI